MSEIPISNTARSKLGMDKRGWNLQRIGSYGVGILVLLFVLAFVHPFGNARVADPGKQLMASAQIGTPVLDVLQRSCQNCHSERTTWPAYSHMAPISWLIEKDVQDGRSHWNMSKWDQYSIDDREHILSQIGPMVRNRKMPLPQYLLLHPEAKLSDADTELVYQWSRQERRRLKSGTPPTAPRD
jgi:Haem-binding domain